MLSCSDKLQTPYTEFSDKLWTMDNGHGHPTLVSVKIGTRILKIKLKMRMKIKFISIFTMFTLILRPFNTIYVEISFHLIVPLKC